MIVIYIASSVIGLISLFAMAQIFAIKALLEDIKVILSPVYITPIQEPE